MRNKYILLRHGETRYQAEGLDILYSKDENPILSITKNGKEKIKEVAKELGSLNIDLVYCSTYHRTRQTAEIVNQELKKEIVFDGRLIDTDFGIFSGKSGDEYREFFSDKKERFKKRIPEGENWNDVRKRVTTVIDEIEEKYQNKTILIIGHADPLWLIAGYLKGYTEEKMIEESNPQGIWPNVGQYFEIK